MHLSTVEKITRRRIGIDEYGIVRIEDRSDPARSRNRYIPYGEIGLEASELFGLVKNVDISSVIRGNGNGTFTDRNFQILDLIALIPYGLAASVYAVSAVMAERKNAPSEAQIIRQTCFVGIDISTSNLPSALSRPTTEPSCPPIQSRPRVSRQKA